MLISTTYKTAARYALSVLFLTLPFFAIVYSPSHWEVSLPWLGDLDIRWVLPSAAVALAVTFFDRRLLRRALQAIGFAVSALCLQGMLSDLWLPLMALVPGPMLSGGLPRTGSRWKHGLLCFSRTLCGLFAVYVALCLPLQQGCAAGSNFTEFIGTYLAVVYIPILAFVCFDATVLLIRWRRNSCADHGEGETEATEDPSPPACSL